MSADVVKFAFIAGELSPTLWGRGDLTKYDLGMAEAYNFFVDYRGGLSSRPGFEFCEFVSVDTAETRLVPFAFNPDLENTYVVVFGEQYVRFIQDGGYVLLDAVNITAVTQAEPPVVTAVAHGVANTKWIKITGVEGMTELNGRTFRAANVTADTLELTEIFDGTDIDATGYGAYTSGGTVAEIYEIVSPYLAEELAGLNFDQYRDTLRITSRDDLPPRDLVRTDHTDWEIIDTVISPYEEGPTITSESMSAAGDAQLVFAVTSVFADGTESAIGNLWKLDNCVNFPVTEGSVSITWTPDPDAIEYKVYCSIVSVTEELSYGTELGYAGRTRGTKFTNPNIIPDFGQTAPTHYHPFAPGAITSIKVTAGGAGYTPASVLTMGGGGSDFDGQVITDDSGAIVAVVIKNGGEGYVTPTLSASLGAGATFDVSARAMTGTYPSLSRIFQQRQVYAASFNNPITLWGSQYKRFDNFSSSDFVLDSDSFEFDLDTAAIAPIKHLLVTRGGLLAMTQDNVWMVNGGGTNEPLTPTNALADRQTYTGVSDLPPLPIDSDILYTEGKGYGVRALSYNEISRVYAGEDKSILANHLFGKKKEIVAWAYQESPFKCVWAIRADGIMLAFTIVKAEDVYAWTPTGTRGAFIDVVSVREITEDRVYVQTQRFIRGRWTKMIERMDLRQFVNVEDAWCVDAGLSLSGTKPAGNVMIYKNSADEWVATASSSVFVDSENKILRAGNGIFRVISWHSAVEAQLEILQAPDNFMPETDDMLTFRSPEGEWTLDTPVTSLGGLWHLEGETVSILADGNVYNPQEVTNGTITLPVGVTRAIVGLAFHCQGKTLPLIVPEAGIEGRRKRIVGVAARVTRSRGLKIGMDYDSLYPMKERTNEAWGQPTALQNTMRYTPIGTTWDEDSHTYFKLEDPLPVTLLSIVQDIEVGDEPD